ncbi:plastocyanin/azurin family copper-binding protein [Hoeflea prorocentri]|uniref:Cupredoxin domain-containing protein n=1 Tax=Hoeflea prorocentri TaxID=1922333 RepID=A0A9X3ZIJ9_9HYPH|nr:plastocyanin/azurin family copper-binding protein [Hoeflea prorocentri]MCY6382093.1 cupredoxin domain-containing protein [Hoeflea prorocentri]MDA5399893.1 cupredoxin domain-containing protein [Hoeflea prorocentri]
MASKVIRRDLLVGAAACAGALATSVNNGLAKTPRTHDIRIKSFEFEPQTITVKVGDTIRWTNEDLAPHTATAVAADWDTGEIVKDDARSIKVTEGMETNYFCAFHPHMKGTIELI